MKKTIVFVINNSHFFISHRMEIGLALINLGHKVYIVSPDAPSDFLLSKGFFCKQVAMSRKGVNPFKELFVIYDLYKLFKDLNPDIVHLITIKPYLYGGIAARLAQVPGVVTAVAGLGILFSQETWKAKFLRALLLPIYKIAFSHSNQKIIFQNNYDYELLEKRQIVSKKKAVYIRGSGANLSEYSYLPESEGVPVISFAARLLKDKGVNEFVSASKILKERGVVAKFWLIGEPDIGNPSAVKKSEIDEWQSQGLVDYLGFRKDVADLFTKSNIVTLPSYYGEGLPKVLIEAAACGRAVVTTDHPGCRDAVSEGTGILVPIKNELALADAFEYLVKNPEVRKSMGLAGRRLAEEEFAVEMVVQRHLSIYEDILGAASNN